MNILVIKQSSLGDVLHSTAALSAIKAAYPACHLTVLTNKASRGVLENNPEVDALVLFDYALAKSHGFCGMRAVLQEFKRVKQQINRRHYQLAFDLQGLLRSAVFLYAAKADKKYIKARGASLGLGLGAGLRLGGHGFRNKQLHAIDEMAGVLNLAGIAMATKQMRLENSAPARQRVAQILATIRTATGFAAALPPLIIISPFTRWRSKNWQLASFIALAAQLSQHHRVLITATAGDKAALDHAIAQVANPDFVSLAGQLNLDELAALMRKAALVVSGDSFPMHLASAVNTPLVALFAPTDENKTAPLSGRVKLLRPPDCQQCAKPNCPRRCLDRLTVAQVRTAAEALL